jgi:hypothetical protein
MAHYAKVVNGLVTKVIVAEEEFFNTFVDDSPGEWIQTSYNTHGGEHPNNTPLRKNFAGIGYTYNRELDAFIPPKPFASWILDEETGLWNAPIAKPEGNYTWNEDEQSWDLVPEES